MEDKSVFEPKAALTNVLKQFQEKWNSNPLSLLAAIPKTEYWRFFIDFIDQDSRESIVLLLEEEEIDKEDFSLTMNEFLSEYDNLNEFFQEEGYNSEKHGCLSLKDYINLQRGWAFYEEREPGYLRGMIAAFNYILKSHIDNQPHQPSIDLILSLHALAAGGVKKTHYDIKHILIGRPGEFRKSPNYITCQLSAINTTFDGMCELAHKIKKQHIPLMFVVRNPDLELDDDIPFAEVDMPGLDPFAKITLNGMDKNPEKYQQILHTIYERFAFPDDEEYLLLGSVLTIDPQDAMKLSLESLLQVYKLTLAEAITPFEKITAMVIFVQNCEQLHPFIDANLRTFVTVFLNHLLIMNGFPPTIMKDPNHFDGYSVAELVTEVIEGMMRVLALADQEIQVEYTTEQLLSQLSTEEVLYFNEALEQIITILPPGQKVPYRLENSFFSSIGKLFSDEKPHPAEPNPENPDNTL